MLLIVRSPRILLDTGSTTPFGKGHLKTLLPPFILELLHPYNLLELLTCLGSGVLANLLGF